MDPSSIQQSFTMALQHHQAGRLHEAEQLYRQILVQEPLHADALHLRGVLAYQTGQYDAAVDLISQALALKPNYPQALSNLGAALIETRRFEEAAATCRRAVELKPDLAEAHSNLGNALTMQGHLDEAIAACQRAIALNPRYPQAPYNLANALRRKGQLDAAIAAYRQAVVLNPAYVEAIYSLGNAYRDRGHLEGAAAAYRRVISVRPKFAEAHCNLGYVLKAQGQTDGAIAAFRQALALKPDFAEAYCNLSAALKDAGLLDEAIATLRRALEVKPDFREVHSNLVFDLNYHPGVDARAIANELTVWQRLYAEPLQSSIEPHSNDRDPGRRLRIGYVSADFQAHASALFLVPLLDNHDEKQVEVFCYAEVPRPDAISRRMQRHIAQWRSTVDVSDEELARQVRDDRIDILVDLKLHTTKNRLLLFARKPAPVQVTWLGYPGSTGLRAIDYRLSDPYLDPPGMDESVYSERTVRLPETFWCYDALEGQGLPVKDLPALAGNAVTFGCLNNFCKINPSVLDVWADVLRAVPSSRLLLLASEGGHRQRTVEHLRAGGVDPARVEFVPRQSRLAYLDAYHRIDVCLDTFPYNGHTTSLDAFWMGVPVITLVGERAVARAGWCQLSNLGLTDLAARSAEEFVRIASALAEDLPRLGELRQTLRQRMKASPLMDAPRFARNMEAAYRAMWQEWCAGNAK